MKKNIKMRHHVARHKERGMSIRDYSHQNGIGYYSMRYWIKKLGNLNCGAVAPCLDLFIELAPFQKEIVSSQMQQLDASASVIPHVELTFPGGLILKIYR